jgi:hypothetical protein
MLISSTFQVTRNTEQPEAREAAEDLYTTFCNIPHVKEIKS